MPAPSQIGYRLSNDIPREASPRAFETIQIEFERLYNILSVVSTRLNVAAQGEGVPLAPNDAQYLLGAADGRLPNGRVVTDTADIAWSLATAGQAQASLASRTALSVIGRASNTNGLPADIVAAAASVVLKRNAANALEFAKADLAADVTGRLPYANLTAATAASRLLGRGSAGGAGDWEEVTLGAGLTMVGTELSATASGSYYEPLTDGDATQPELIFASGDVIMVEVP
jgi:hypothetical protein